MSQADALLLELLSQRPSNRDFAADPEGKRRKAFRSVSALPASGYFWVHQDYVDGAEVEWYAQEGRIIHLEIHYPDWKKVEAGGSWDIFGLDGMLEGC